MILITNKKFWNWLDKEYPGWMHKFRVCTVSGFAKSEKFAMLGFIMQYQFLQWVDSANKIEFPHGKERPEISPTLEFSFVIKNGINEAFDDAVKELNMERLNDI